MAYHPLFLRQNRIARPVTGGLLLDRFQGAPRPADGHLTEEWIASTVPVNGGDGRRGLSLLRDSPNETLAQRISADPAGMLGAGHLARFGQNPALLVKLIDAESRLLIQAHPNGEQARRLFGSPFGKTEAWYVIATRGPGARVHLGFREGIDRAVWEELFRRQDRAAMLEALHSFPAEPGDVVFLPAGLPHALGAGCLVAEVQEPADITIRTERRRPDGGGVDDFTLHQGAGFQAMFDCFDYTPRSREQTARRFLFHGREGALIGPETTPCFSMYERRLPAGTGPERPGGGFSIALVLEGEGTLEGGFGALPYARADEVFLPAALGPLRWRAGSPSRILECFPPDTRT